MNKNIQAASKIKKNAKRDEFYTTADTANRMIANLDLSQLSNKTIYCNCDGPESEIYKMFKHRFAEFGLKGVLATKFVKDGKGIKTFYDGHIESVSSLEGDGSFQSAECLELLDCVDVVATNPPFSLLGQYVKTMLTAGKDLIVIANIMCLTYKDILPFYLKGLFHECSNFSGGVYYLNFDPVRHETVVSSIAFTTLRTVDWRKLPYKTTAELDTLGKLRHDDNTGELEVKYIRDIPVDLKGTCLVPITAGIFEKLLQKYEILGIGKNVIVNGKPTFTRIRIQRRPTNEDSSRGELHRAR